MSVLSSNHCFTRVLFDAGRLRIALQHCHRPQAAKPHHMAHPQSKRRHVRLCVTHSRPSRPGNHGRLSSRSRCLLSRPHAPHRPAGCVRCVQSDLGQPPAVCGRCRSVRALRLTARVLRSPQQFVDDVTRVRNFSDVGASLLRCTAQNTNTLGNPYATWVRHQLSCGLRLMAWSLKPTSGEPANVRV